MQNPGPQSTPLPASWQRNRRPKPPPPTCGPSTKRIQGKTPDRHEDGITRNFALGAAGVIIVLALVMMLLIGMLISGNGDAEPGSTIDPTPSVMAAEQETETPTSDLRTVDQEDATETPARPQTGTKTEYSTCLLRTQKSLLLDIEDARFTPWPDYWGALAGPAAGLRGLEEHP